MIKVFEDSDKMWTIGSTPKLARKIMEGVSV